MKEHDKLETSIKNLNELLKLEDKKNKQQLEEINSLNNSNHQMQKQITKLMQSTGDVVQENQIANFESEKLNSQL